MSVMVIQRSKGKQGICLCVELIGGGELDPHHEMGGKEDGEETK